MSYQLNRVHLLICIFAGIVLAAGFVWHIFFRLPHSLFTMALWVSSAIVLFYFIGHIIRSVLINQVFVPSEDYDFSDDPEYQAIFGNNQEDNSSPPNVMFDEPLMMDSFDDDELNDPFLESMALKDL